MKTDSAQISKMQAVRKELEKEVLKKITAIQEKVLTHKSQFPAEDLQILMIVNDELDDVLLNWEVGQISALPPISPLSRDYDDLDEFDD